MGLRALREAAYRAASPDPLDVLGSETQGMLGYLIEEALRRELPGAGYAEVGSGVGVLVENEGRMVR